MSRRGNTNGNQRGNSADRRRRRQWLLDHFGNGTTAPCSMCGRPQDINTVSVDCWPVPRCDGGTYDKTNIRPACDSCQARQGGLMAQARRRARLEKAS
jgi:hypothetical protein